MKHFKNERLSR